MDSSSSSSSCFSVGSTSPGAVVLLYSVCARGSEAGAGPRERTPFSWSRLPPGRDPGPRRVGPSLLPTPAGGIRCLIWFLGQRCIAACGNVRVLLEVSPGDGSAGSLPLVPSFPLHQALGLQNAPDTGTRRGELESLHLLRGVLGYLSVEPEEPAV